MTIAGSSAAASAAFDPSGRDIILFARDELAAGRPVALATLVKVEGSFPRAPGAQIAIAADGRRAGSISSGCLERAIAEAAKSAIDRRRGAVIRYGRGSPFIDVKLPCGSGVDIMVTVGATFETLSSAAAILRRREACSITFDVGGASLRQVATNGAFVRRYRPSLRLVAAGYGPELTILSRLAGAAGHHVCALSPDEASLMECAAMECVHLKSPDHPPPLAIDQWTACALLFHDRAFEAALAPMFLRSPAFYVGAVGGATAAATRVKTLRGLGLAEAEISRLSSPVGLMPATRDPSALALSTLAEVVAAWSRLA